MIESTIRIKGLSELHRALQHLPEELEKKVLKGALRASARVFRDAARAKAPVDDGDLKKSIRVKSSAKKGRWRLRALVVAGDKTAFYSNMVEFGTAKHIIAARTRVQRKTRRGMRDLSLKTMNKMLYRGTLRVDDAGSLRVGDKFIGPAVTHPGAAPHPFMRPAFDEQSGAAIDAFAAYVDKRLGKEGITA